MITVDVILQCQQLTLVFGAALLTNLCSLNKPLLASRDDEDIDDAKRRI
jgi:hypothetical protein